MADLDLAGAVQTLSDRMGQALVQAVTDGPFAEAQANVPVDTAALKGTGAVTGPVVDGDTITVTMSWGNPDDATGIYAIVQHEDTALKHPNGGTAKWCENAQLAYAPRMAAEVARRMEG